MLQHQLLNDNLHDWACMCNTQSRTVADLAYHVTATVCTVLLSQPGVQDTSSATTGMHFKCLSYDTDDVASYTQFVCATTMYGPISAYSTSHHRACSTGTRLGCHKLPLGLPRCVCTYILLTAFCQLAAPGHKTNTLLQLDYSRGAFTRPFWAVRGASKKAGACRRKGWQGARACHSDDLPCLEPDLWRLCERRRLELLS